MLVSLKIFTGVCISTEHLLHMLFWHKNVFRDLLTLRQFSLKKKKKIRTSKPFPDYQSILKAPLNPGWNLAGA